MGRNEDLCIRQVTAVDRLTKTTGGRMRPKLRVYYKCQLSCGHLGERMKGPNQEKPPVRMTCMECRRLELATSA